MGQGDISLCRKHQGWSLLLMPAVSLLPESGQSWGTPCSFPFPQFLHLSNLCMSTRMKQRMLVIVMIYQGNKILSKGSSCHLSLCLLSGPGHADQHIPQCWSCWAWPLPCQGPASPCHSILGMNWENLFFQCPALQRYLRVCGIHL